MRVLASVFTITVLGACTTAAPRSSEKPTSGSFEPSAKFEIEGPGQRERHLSWSTEQNLIFCRHYAEPERGDYLWIRLAETPEQDGDAGVRLDIDVCRLGAVTGSVPPMPAGQHGSLCAEDPGFAIWWHEGEAAFNTGPVAPDGCELTLDYDPTSKRLRGKFECDALTEAERKSETQSGREIHLAAGSFSCVVETMTSSRSP